MIERYVAGRGSTWTGYCEYDRERSQYRHWMLNYVFQPTWHHLSHDALEGLLITKDWVPQIPPDQQLPEGF